jgi:hypothetical protein
VSAVPDETAPIAAGRPGFAPDAASLAAAVVLVLSATTVVLANIDSRTGRNYQLHTLLIGSDLSLLALTLVAARRLPAAFRAWRRHACVLAGLAVGVSLVPAFLVHPSDRGAAALLRWAAGVALGLTVGAARRDGRRLIIGALGFVTLAHVTVALAQRASGGPIGLGSIGEPGGYAIGGRFAASGLTVHPYVLAAWCVVAGTALLVVGRHRKTAGGLATIAGIAAFGGIGLTMSRAGALAAALALGALAVAAVRSADRAWRGNVMAAGLALGAGVLVNLSAWLSRAGKTGSVDAISSGRGALLRQAWPLLGDNLLTGVGPGRYVLALLERPELVALSDQTPRPVHVTPLLLVVEGGLLVVPALVLLAIAIGWACCRGGAAVALTRAMVPFLVLDHLAWSYPQGIVLTGVWLGTLDRLGRKDDDEGDEKGDVGCDQAGVDADEEAARS